MRNFLGSMVILLGLALGIYVGFWVFLVGGLTQFIETIREPEITKSALAFSVLKMLTAGFVGFVATLPGIVLGRRIIHGEWR